MLYIVNNFLLYFWMSRGQNVCMIIIGIDRALYENWEIHDSQGGNKLVIYCTLCTLYIKNEIENLLTASQQEDKLYVP